MNNENTFFYLSGLGNHDELDEIEAFPTTLEKEAELVSALLNLVREDENILSIDAVKASLPEIETGRNQGVKLSQQLAFLKQQLADLHYENENPTSPDDQKEIAEFRENLVSARGIAGDASARSQYSDKSTVTIASFSQAETTETVDIVDNFSLRPVEDFFEPKQPANPDTRKSLADMLRVPPKKFKKAAPKKKKRAPKKKKT